VTLIEKLAFITVYIRYLNAFTILVDAKTVGIMRMSIFVSFDPEPEVDRETANIKVAHI
jgi:hypothetical protein